MCGGPGLGSAIGGRAPVGVVPPGLLVPVHGCVYGMPRCLWSSSGRGGLNESLLASCVEDQCVWYALGPPIEALVPCGTAASGGGASSMSHRATIIWAHVGCTCQELCHLNGADVSVWVLVWWWHSRDGLNVPLLSIRYQRLQHYSTDVRCSVSLGLHGFLCQNPLGVGCGAHGDMRDGLLQPLLCLWFLGLLVP